MTIYTIVAYKPSGYSYRDQEYWESNFEVHIFETIEEAVQCILRYKIIAKECKVYNDDDWETRLLIDGLDDDYWPDGFSEEEYYKRQEPFWAIQEKAKELFTEWLTKVKEREEEAKKKKLAQEEAARKATERRQIEQEKALLKTLQEKYGS